MIISCEKCNKKFELNDNLIPKTGRLLQCGSCSYQWHFVPDNKIELVNEVKNNVKTSDQVKKTIQKPIKEKIKKRSTAQNKNIHQSYLEETGSKERKIGFLSFLLVLIISLASLVILLDTFKHQLSSFIPNIDFYLASLYDTLKDIFLFFTDLLK